MTFLNRPAGAARARTQTTPAPAAQAAPSAAAAPADRKYLLERVDEAAVVQVYADGFRDLPLKEKTLVWHLYQAAIAGRDIFYDQRYAHNLEMRDVLEAIVTHPGGVDPANARPRFSATRSSSGSTPAPTTTSPRASSCSRARPTRSPPRRMRRKRAARSFRSKRRDARPAAGAAAPMFFDPNVDPTVTSKTPPAGKDILTASANNLYVGVTMKDLEGFHESIR